MIKTNNHKARGTEMKNWDTKKIETILNAVYGNGIKENKNGFEIQGNELIAIDIDRGPRTDHGGIDGDGWMSGTEINAEIERMAKRHSAKLKAMITLLKENGYSAQWMLDYGEKGHVSIYIASKDPKKKETKKESNPVLKRNPTKAETKTDPAKETNPVIKRNATATKADPKAGKKINQTDFIRMKINGLENRENLIAGLAKYFEKKTKWATSRLATYEKAYGNFGANDPKLRK